jgi:hypothetical protein
LVVVKTLGVAIDAWSTGDETLSLPALDPSICRQCRAVLRWSRARLGKEANLSGETIRVYERGDGATALHVNHVAAIVAALRAAGIEFVADHETGGTNIRFAQTQHNSQFPVKTADNC